MSTSLPKLVNNLCEGVHNDKCTDCKSYLDYMTTKDEQLIFRWYEFCSGDLNKFILLLRKGVYPYEYMDSWKRFSETSFPEK